VKYFLWEQHRGPEITPFRGPYFIKYVELIGKKFIHTDEELAKLSYSKTTQKRIASARPGTQIKIFTLSLETDIYIRCLTDDEYQDYNQMVFLKTKLDDIRAQIRACIPAHLSQEEADLEKKYSKLTKKWGFRPSG